MEHDIAASTHLRLRRMEDVEVKESINVEHGCQLLGRQQQRVSQTIPFFLVDSIAHFACWGAPM